MELGQLKDTALLVIDLQGRLRLFLFHGLLFVNVQSQIWRVAILKVGIDADTAFALDRNRRRFLHGPF